MRAARLPCAPSLVSAGLLLHDPVWYDHMPYLPFPDSWPVFTPRDKIADWLEMYANASSDGLPVDIRDFALINGVRHVPLPQETSPDCQGRLIRACGDIVVDVEMLLRTIVDVARVLGIRVRTGARVGAVRWR